MKKVLTVPAVADILREHKGCTIVTLTAATKPRCLKRDRETGEPNPWGQIVKVSMVQGLIGFRYENSVNNQREREGDVADFEAEPRSWGHHVENPSTGNPSPLVTNNAGDRTYIEVKVERVLSTTYHAEDGTVLTYDECKGVLPARKEESSRQELDKPVILRDYALDNVVGLSMNGNQIQVV